MGEWTEARKVFERKAQDKGHRKYDSKYEEYWAFFQAGVNFGKAQKSKICVWKKTEQQQKKGVPYLLWEAACSGRLTLTELMPICSSKYCPDCGGKIEVKS